MQIDNMSKSVHWDYKIEVLDIYAYKYYSFAVVHSGILHEGTFAERNEQWINQIFQIK